jgi:dihydroorotate dehydrogenase (fumarate)
MDLSTTYLGLQLPHPLMPGASPLVDDLDTVRRLEDAGAAAIVMHSLFEEQIADEQVGAWSRLEADTDSHPEAASYLPRPGAFVLDPDRYLEQIRRIKEAVRVPVIGSLNGTTPGGWLRYAGLIEEAGADAIELNIYHVATDPCESGQDLEFRALELVHAVKHAVRIPVAVKLSPFYSSLAAFAVEIDERGADGLVLFNRFYQPDIEIEALEVVPALRLSGPEELLLRLRWVAVLRGRLRAALAVTGGVHASQDALKAVMAGADAVQMVSALLRHGPAHLRAVRAGMEAWMEQHGYESLRQLRGCLSLERCPDPTAFERANYLKVLATWRANHIPETVLRGRRRP